MLFAAFLLASVGCSRGSPPAPGQSAEPEPGAIRLAAVGDSITDANSPNFAAGDLGSESWVSYAIGADVAFAGGWARWGATTAEMARNVAPVDAGMLVIMAGTNDVALGVPFTQVAHNLTEITRAVGAREVLIAGIPPIDHSPGSAIEFNTRLERLAGERGWQWVDAGAGVRTGAGAFKPGMASDGVHPSARGARHLGEAIGAAIRAATG